MSVYKHCSTLCFLSALCLEGIEQFDLLRPEALINRLEDEGDIVHSRIVLVQDAGFFYGIAAMALMAASIVLMRPVLSKAHVFWVTEVRMLAALLVLLIMFSLQKGRRGQLAPLWRRGSRGYAFSSALLGNLVSMTLWIAAFKFTTVNSAAILNQTNTVLVVILAAIFLKDRFDLRRLAATLLAVAGSVLILLG